MDTSANPGEQGAGIGIPEGFGNRKGTPLWSNVGFPERLASAAVGGGLLYLGIRSFGIKRRIGLKRKRKAWLTALLAVAGGNLLLRGALGRSVIYRVLGISTAGIPSRGFKGPLRVERKAAVDRPAHEIYRFWRNFENLPRIMNHLKAVRAIDERRSHWVAKGPAGMDVEWDAEITDDQDGRRIAWRSLEGSDVFNIGSVTFEPQADGRGTEIRVELEYNAPGGKAGAALAKVLGRDPGRQIEKDLAKLKRMMEAGEPAESQYARS